MDYMPLVDAGRSQTEEFNVRGTDQDIRKQLYRELLRQRQSIQLACQILDDAEKTLSPKVWKRVAPEARRRGDGQSQLPTTRTMRLSGDDAIECEPYAQFVAWCHERCVR
jgi:hypothetical protein